jgi:hypothetical protein
LHHQSGAICLFYLLLRAMKAIISYNLKISPFGDNFMPLKPRAQPRK